MQFTSTHRLVAGLAILTLVGMSACAGQDSSSDSGDTDGLFSGTENDLALSQAEYDNVGVLLTQAAASTPVMTNYRGLGISTVTKMGSDYCALVLRFGADDATPAYRQMLVEQAGVSPDNVATLGPIAVSAASFMCADDVSGAP
ncbi:MAG: hypothetical protein ACI83Y_002229 [Candidatus Azotimanducaceae bacterium]|jgi:hypothetical protein|tara:strand:+ start:320 stop:751 length:432 start_codon:yes stop_codon:yes gene_type:complete